MLFSAFLFEIFGEHFQNQLARANAFHKSLIANLCPERTRRANRGNDQVFFRLFCLCHSGIPLRERYSVYVVMSICCLVGVSLCLAGLRSCLHGLPIASFSAISFPRVARP